MEKTPTYAMARVALAGIEDGSEPGLTETDSMRPKKFNFAHAEQIKTEYENARPLYNTSKYFLVYPEYLD